LLASCSEPLQTGSLAVLGSHRAQPCGVTSGASSQRPQSADAEQAGGSAGGHGELLGPPQTLVLRALTLLVDLVVGHQSTSTFLRTPDPWIEKFFSFPSLTLSHTSSSWT